MGDIHNFDRKRPDLFGGTLPSGSQGTAPQSSPTQHEQPAQKIPTEREFRLNNWTLPGYPNLVANMNLFYAYNENSRSPIMHFGPTGEVDFISLTNFYGEFIAFKIQTTTTDAFGKKVIDEFQVGPLWLNSPNRRNHKKLVFDPKRIYGIDDEEYNFWG